MKNAKSAVFDMSIRTPGERLVVWGVRTLVTERRAGVLDGTALEPVFLSFGVSGGVASLERFLDVLAQAAHTPLLLHPVGCRCLSPGEADLLGILACAHGDDRAALRGGLAQWLPRHALDWAEMPLLGLARTLAVAGLCMPSRQRRPVVHRWGSAATGHPTLH